MFVLFVVGEMDALFQPGAKKEMYLFPKKNMTSLEIIPLFGILKQHEDVSENSGTPKSSILMSFPL